MNNPSQIIKPVIFLLMLAGSLFSQIKPNIIFVLVDDMGIGDIKAFNSEAKTTTPELDKLAESGMMFRDAHASASSCIPSRYGLLTGRYPYRINNLNAWRTEPLINQGRTTIASVLKDGGYKTGMVGKWHLGFNYSDMNNLTGGPVDRGFDYYFGISRSLDQADYYYIENRKATSPPTVDVAASAGYGQNGWQGPFWRAGKMGQDFVHAEVLGKFIDKSIEFVNNNAAGSDTLPFFLYVALASPHTPWLIADKYKGTSPIGDWGDWMTENDAEMGRLFQAVYDAGLRENTLIFFTSDNGPVWWQTDIDRTGHDATGVFRGMKFDAWEGGHRMPFIASWPGVIPAGTTSGQIITTVDMLATFAAMVGETLPNNMAEDSYNIWPALLDPNLSTPVRGPFVERPDGNRPLTIREGPWKLLNSNTLYNLENDSGETNNVFNQNQAIANDLAAKLNAATNNSRTVPIPRENPISVFGCKDSLSGQYNVDDIIELPGFCPVPVNEGAAKMISDHYFQIKGGSIEIFSTGHHKIHLTAVNGELINVLEGKGSKLYKIGKSIGPGVYVAKIQTENRIFTRMLTTDL